MSFRQQFQQIEKEKQYAKEQSFVRPDYVFHSNFHKQKSLSSQDTTNGRYYSLSSGVKLPSVTTVLAATKSEESRKSLERWIKRVGEEEAERIKNNAANRGTIMHNLCENFILDNDKFKLPEYDTNDFSLFRQIYPLLCRIDNIHSIEGTLYSERLGCAGRVDCVAEFDGVLSIIDFKTSRKVKEDRYIEDYYIQECLYSLMFSEMFNVKVKQIVTLMSIDNDIDAKEGLIFIKKPFDFVEKAVYRVRQYYQGMN